MPKSSLLDFFERAYFAELERKNRLHTALAFPVSVVVVGVTLLGFASERLEGLYPLAVLLYLLFLVSVLSFIVFVRQVARFLIDREYQYIWTLNQTLQHRDELSEFSRQFPDAPDASETFEEHLLKDIAFCTSKNSKLNDERSENLYWANVSSFIFVLSTLLIVIVATVSKVIIQYVG